MESCINTEWSLIVTHDGICAVEGYKINNHMILWSSAGRWHVGSDQSWDQDEVDIPGWRIWMHWRFRVSLLGPVMTCDHSVWSCFHHTVTTAGLSRIPLGFKPCPCPPSANCNLFWGFYDMLHIPMFKSPLSDGIFAIVILPCHLC